MSEIERILERLRQSSLDFHNRYKQDVAGALPLDPDTIRLKRVERQGMREYMQDAVDPWRSILGQLFGLK